MLFVHYTQSSPPSNVFCHFLIWFLYACRMNITFEWLFFKIHFCWCYILCDFLFVFFFVGLSWLVEHLVGSTLMERPWRSLWRVCLTHIAMSWMLLRPTSTCSWRRSDIFPKTISTNQLYNVLMSFTTMK